MKQTLSDIATILKVSRLPFHLTGGLASSFHGEPRFTQDIDIVIRVSLGSALTQLMNALSNQFIVDRTAIEEAVSLGRMFQALHKETMIKIDFHVGEAIPGELKRSHSEEILSGIFMPLVSKEDAILSKLLWVAQGSHKSRDDIKAMLKRSGKIDFEYLKTQASKLGIQALLKELQDEATE